MKKGIFINTRPARCSIYQSGKTIFENLQCTKWHLDYVEIDKISKDDFRQGRIVGPNLNEYYDFYIFNYHPLTMRNFENINTDVVRNFKGHTINLVFEVDVNDPFPSGYVFNKDDFDDHIIFDPTFVEDNNLHSFFRPLSNYRFKPQYLSLPKKPTIGSFGYPNIDKNFPAIIQQASKEFIESKVKINIPFATYGHENDAYLIADECRRIKPNNVELEITHDFYEYSDLVNWCNQNDLNVFLYSRKMPGLSSAVDEAILSGSPIAISNNPAFRHLHQFLKSFPDWTFVDSILKSQRCIKEMSKLWSKENFILKFEEILIRK